LQAFPSQENQYYSENDKKHKITFVFYHKAVVKQDYYTYDTLDEFCKHRFVWYSRGKIHRYVAAPQKCLPVSLTTSGFFPSGLVSQKG
jgi:hypothetical protein